MIKPNDVDPATVLSDVERGDLAKYEQRIDDDLRKNGVASVSTKGKTDIPRELAFLANRYSGEGWLVWHDEKSSMLWIKHPMLVKPRRPEEIRR